MVWSLAAAFAADGGQISRDALPNLPSLALQGMPQEVTTRLEELYTEVRQRPMNADANGRLGQLLHAYEQFESAAICYERAGLLDARAFRWPYYRGVVLALARQPTRAIESFRKALSLSPDDRSARLHLARLTFESGDFPAAEDLYQTLERDASELPEVQYGLGRALAAAGRKSDAVQRFRAACQLAPGYGAAHYSLAKTLQELGAKEEADKHFALFLRYRNQTPVSSHPWLQQIEAIRSADPLEALRRGVQAEADGDLERAVIEQERALHTNPSLVQAHINLIGLYGRLRRPEEAGKHYRAALRLSPDQAELHYNYGLLLAAQQRTGEAIECFRRALDTNPYFAEANVALGQALESERQFEAALKQYRQALENKPNHRMAQFQLARLLVIQNRYGEAIGYFRQALTEEDGQTPLLLFGLATAYAGSGNTQEALAAARKARARAVLLKQADLVKAIDRDFPDGSQ